MASRSVRHAQRIGREADYVPYLPYLRHASDDVIILQNGCCMRMYAIEGRSFETSDPDELAAWHNSLNILFRSLCDDRFAIWTHVVRRPIEPYRPQGFRSRFAAELDEQYYAKLLGRTIYRNDFYVTLIVKPGDLLADKLTGFLGLKRAGEEEIDPRSLQLLDEKCRDFESMLSLCEPHVLATYEHDGVLFSRPLEILHYVMTGDNLRIPIIDGPIGQALYSSRIIFGSESIEFRLPHQTHYGVMFGIRDYVAQTKTGQFNALLKLNMGFVLTQSFTSFVKSSAMDKLHRRQRQLASSDDVTSSQADELVASMDGLNSNRFVMGDHHLSLMVTDHDPKRLIDRVSRARAALADTGMVAARESLALEAAFWAQLPGNWQMRARPAAISSRNFAAMSPFYTYPAGHATNNHWGDAVALLQTTSGSSFWFNFHNKDLGHTLVIGPTGAGKTVLQNFLMSQLEKSGATQIFIDKDRGAEIFVRACGGTYLPLRNGVRTGFAPLKGLGNGPADIAFLQQFVRVLVRRDNRPFTVAEELRIDEGIEAVLRLDPAERSLGALRQVLGYKDAEGIGPRLDRWTRDGALGWVFDNEADELSLGAAFIGFDMTDFLDHPEVRTPIMLYLFHRIDALLDGRRVVVDIDEFWKALEDDAFRAFAQDGLKTYRKRNGILVFGTQSPADALRSPISHSIIEQTATKIILPNPYGRERDYREGLGLTAAEYKLIKEELSPESRAFLIKQGANSVVARLDLSGMDDAIAVLSGRAETLQLMERAREQSGPRPDDWLPRFHAMRRDEMGGVRS
jgi:type IV secretion system protein VirB4